MRWLTLLLLTLNLVIFAFYWQNQQQQAQLLQRQQRLPDAPRLRLLSEVEAPRERSSKEPVPAADMASAAEPSVSLEGGSVSSVASVSADVEQGSTAAVDAESQSEGVVSVAGASVPELDLVEAAVQIEEPVVTACLRMAYFDSHDAASAVVTDANVVRQEVIEERQWLPSDYWVYIPDPGTSALRRTMRKELSDMGFENYWIQRGYLKGRLSLGLYRNQDSAQALLHLLQDRGFMPRIYENTRYSAHYLVEIEVQSTVAGVAELRSALQQRYVDIKTEKKPCQGLASLELAE